MPVRPGRKVCKDCHRIKPLADFANCRFTDDGKYYRCKLCSHLERRLVYQNPKMRMYRMSFNRAKAKGIEHTITPDDIPIPFTCKYLGVELDYNVVGESGRIRPWNSPSIDRIDNSRGYVPGNIQVISNLANRMKQDATIEQLVAFAEGVLRVHGGKH